MLKPTTFVVRGTFGLILSAASRAAIDLRQSSPVFKPDGDGRMYNRSLLSQQ